MDELEAVNMMLRAIGSSPVNALNSPQPDVGNARDTLNRYRSSAQNRGWWFNIDYCVKFVRSVNSKEIRVPKEYSLVVFENPNIVLRGTRLYNKLDQTYQFTTDQIAARTVYTLPWDELPNSMQEHIAYSAAASFVLDEIEDVNKAAKFEEKAGIASFDVKKEDLEQGQYNIFDRGRIRSARLGVLPYNQRNGAQARFGGVSQYEN